MGHHLTDKGTFKSNKYDWCPEGFFALKFSDRMARSVMVLYASLTDDKELADDLLDAVYSEERRIFDESKDRKEFVQRGG